jgi:hypothetical protein
MRNVEHISDYRNAWLKGKQYFKTKLSVKILFQRGTHHLLRKAPFRSELTERFQNAFVDDARKPAAG